LLQGLAPFFRSHYLYIKERLNFYINSSKYCSGVNITSNNHFAFKTACEKYFIDIVEWLCYVNDKYSFIYDNVGKIIPIIKSQFDEFITNNTCLIKVLKKLKCKII